MASQSPVTPGEGRLAEALLRENLRGERAPDIIYERVKALAEANDRKGVKRWMVIADWLDRLQRPDGPTSWPGAGHVDELNLWRTTRVGAAATRVALFDTTSKHIAALAHNVAGAAVAIWLSLHGSLPPHQLGTVRDRRRRSRDRASSQRLRYCAPPRPALTFDP
jgi:hypothetical protein